MGEKPNNSAALSRLFSSSVIRELATKGKSAALVRLAKEAGAWPSAVGSKRVRHIFDAALAMLGKRNLRDEYVYKSALTGRVLLGKHSLRTASMLSEFRVGDSKADIVILNGTSTVYEIKSERDSLSRLERQIENYRSLFASVVVIAGKQHVSSVLSATPSDVGVMSLDHRGYISTRREACDLPERISPLVAFNSLRTEEVIKLLDFHGIALPEVPNTQLRSQLRESFLKLHPKQIHNGMLRVLKQTRNLQPLSVLVDQLPHSLHAAVLSIPLRRGDHDRLVNAVNVPLKSAAIWS